MTTLCLDGACQSLDDYNAAIKRFSQLLKPGGKIFIFGLERNTEISDPGMYVSSRKRVFSQYSSLQRNDHKGIRECKIY